MNLTERAASVIPVLAELRVARPSQPLTMRWSQLPVEAAGNTLLGVSFRPLQAREFGLDPQRALAELLPYPFPLIRLAAYWDQLERAPRGFDTAVLDQQIDAAHQAGKKIILCVGAVKAFGYPEFFVPAHHAPVPLPEGQLIGERAHKALLDAAVDFVTRIVDRYRAHPNIV